MLTPRDGTGDPTVRVENVMKEVHDLQEKTKELTDEETALIEELKFAREEEVRAKDLIAVAEQELGDVTEVVERCLKEKDEHHCAASGDDLTNLQALLTENKSKSHALRRKEMHIQALLQSTQEEMDFVARLQHQRNDPADLVMRLKVMVEQQDIEVAALTQMQEDGMKLTDELATNDIEIKKRRHELEVAGVEIPVAPMVHRTQRIIDQRKRLQQLEEQQKAQSSSSVVTRPIELPVGVLNLITTRLGGTLKSIVQGYGVDSFSVELHDNKTLLQCRGVPSAIGALETKLKDTVAEALSGSAVTSGLVTYSAAGGTGQVCQETAGKIAALLGMEQAAEN